MTNCGFCGAKVTLEKAWCPNCNQPLEHEDRRQVAREIDTFAGTMIDMPKRPRASMPSGAELERSAVAVSEPVVARLPPPPPIAPTPPPAVEPPFRPSVVTKVATPKPSRTWLYLLVGGLIGLILLMALAGVVALWFFFG